MLKNASVLDVISVGAQRDCIVVLPTLKHAIHWWPKLILAVKEHHRGEPWVANTRTAIICKDTQTVTRLWVPYAREPTMPMDIARDRVNREMLYLYWRP